MKIGDYVRTDKGTIDKLTRENIMIYEVALMGLGEKPIKSSPNIIDLLKKKDIVIDYKGNIYQVVKVWKDYVFTDKKNEYGQVITLVDYQIKSILTKEKFESMEYKIGE